MLATSAPAFASETNWMIYVQVSNPDGTGAGVYNQFGVKPLATDGVDSNYDLAYDYGTGGNTVKAASQVIPGSYNVYQRNFISTASYVTYPNQTKSWSFRVAGLSGADTSTGTRLVFRTATSPVVKNPEAVPSVWEWKLKLVNDQGQTINKPGGGRWAEGEYIVLYVPTSLDTLFGQIDLPTIRLTSDDAKHMLSQGYEFEVFIGIPEPGSLLALGTGLAGLVALARRSRFRAPH